MSLFDKGDVLITNTDESIVINEVLLDEINKVICLASKNENYGLLVWYANIDLSEQLRIAKVISTLSINNSKYKLCKFNMEGIGFFIKGCNKIIESNLFVEFQNREELCINLVTEFMMIHKEGLSFAEVGLTSFAYNKYTNEIGIITPEKIGDYGEKIENISGWLTGCIAPEVVSNVQLPDIYSDRYSLAVMLFKVLFGTDPMLGKGIKSEMEAFPGRVYKQWWNEERLFIFDKDQSNACSDDEVIEKWKATDAKIRVEFEKNFSRATKREERTSERCWITLFKQNKAVVKEDLKLKSQVYHLVFIVANPISMQGVKIGTVNSALEELIPELRFISEANYGIDIHLSIMTVSNNAKWSFFNTQINREFDWEFLMTSESNEINVASAMELLRKDFIIPNRLCSQMVCPTIIWFVDNHVIGNYKYQLEINNLFALYKNTIVYGVSMGDGADDEFLNYVCSKVVKVHTPEMLMKFIEIIDFDESTDDVIKIIDGTFPDEKSVYVMRELGENGRAKEYYCLYDNTEAIYREFYNPIISMAELYDETKKKIKSGELPGEWPVALSELYEDNFGYVYKKLSI